MKSFVPNPPHNELENIFPISQRASDGLLNIARVVLMRTVIRAIVRLAALAVPLVLSACYMPVQDEKPTARSAAPPVNLPPPGPEHVSVDSRWTFSAYENPRPLNGSLTRPAAAPG